MIPPGAGDRVVYEEPYAGESGSFLRNPYVLAGMVVGGAILMAVLFVVFFGGGGGTTGGNASNSGGAVNTPAPGRGVAGKSIVTSSVREAPEGDAPVIGTLRSGQDVEVVGRNNQTTWLQIFFPTNSQLKGWVPASALRLADGVSETLTVVASTPISRPTFVQPTSPPRPTAAPTVEATEVPQTSPTAAPGGGGGADLAVSVLQTTCVPGQVLTVVIRNIGSAPLASREMRVSVSTPNGLLGTSSVGFSLDPGAVINLPTGQVAQAPRTTVTVDLIGVPGDANAGNNSADCVISAPATPTVPPTQPTAQPTATQPPVQPTSPPVLPTPTSVVVPPTSVPVP